MSVAQRERRSQQEADQLARADAAAFDVALAERRGDRVLMAVDAAIDALHAVGMLRCSRTDARRLMFSPVADALYGNAAVDIPSLGTR